MIKIYLDLLLHLQQMSFTKNDVNEQPLKRVHKYGKYLQPQFKKKQFWCHGDCKILTGKDFSHFYLPNFTYSAWKPQRNKTPPVLFFFVEPTREIAVAGAWKPWCGWSVWSLKSHRKSLELRRPQLVSKVWPKQLKKPQYIVIAKPLRCLDFLEYWKLLLCGVQFLHTASHLLYYEKTLLQMLFHKQFQLFFRRIIYLINKFATFMGHRCIYFLFVVFLAALP